MSKLFSNTPLVDFSELNNKQIVITDRIYSYSHLQEISKKLKKDTFFITLDEKFGNSRKLKSLLAEWDEADKIRRFTWHKFGMANKYICHDHAFDLIDEAYSKWEPKGKGLIKLLTHLYQDNNVKYAIKKTFLNELLVAITLLKVADYLRQYTDVLIVPSPFCTEILPYLNSHIDAGSIHTYKSKDSFKTKLNYAFRPLFIGLRSLLSIRNIVATPPAPKPQQIAIQTEPRFWKFGGEGTIEADWIVDGKVIQNKNVMHVIVEDVSPQMHREIINRNYNLINFSRINAFRTISVAHLMRLVSYIFFTTTRFIPMSMSSPCMLANSAASGLTEWTRWTGLFDFWRPQHYLTYNDMTDLQIYRNAVLKRHKCEAVSYQHSASAARFYDGKSYTGRDVTLAYLYYSKQYVWSKPHLELWTDQRNLSDNIIVSGCTWGPMVNKTPKISAMIQNIWPNKNGPLICAFPSAFGPGGSNLEEAHIVFLEGLLEVLQHHEDAHVLMKGKSSVESFSIGYRDTYKSLIERLENTLRFKFLDQVLAAGPLIAESDLVIAMTFESPALEAIYAGKGALFYDGINQYPFSLYQQFDNLVFNNLPALLEEVSSRLSSYPSEQEPSEQNLELAKNIMQTDYVPNPISFIREDLFQ